MNKQLAFDEVADQLNDALAQVVDLFARTFHARADIRTLSGLTFVYYRKQIFYAEAPSDHVPVDRATLALRVEFTKHAEELWSACREAESGLREQAILARDRALSFVKEHK